MKKQKLIIIGAGLSGLYAAYLLQNDYDITVLEARERLGGRVYGIEGHDMGPSWIWPHQKNILDLIQEMDLKIFAQYTHGLALYDVPQGVERFHPPQESPSGRIQGGISQLIHAVAQKLSLVDIKCNQPVQAIKVCSEQLIIQTDTSTFSADKVISTLPPRLAASVEYTPPLPQSVTQKLTSTPTWMGYATKCVIRYEEPFWREMGLSGFAFSHRGPLGEIHDATTQNQAALFGFLHTHAKADPNAIIEQLRRMYGPQALEYTDLHIMPWHQEPFTATAEDAKALTQHPAYGFRVSHFDNRLYFSGSETALQEGGYLEGAVIAAKTIAATLKD